MLCCVDSSMQRFLQCYGGCSVTWHGACCHCKDQEKCRSSAAHRSPSGSLHHPALLLEVIFVLAMKLHWGYGWNLASPVKMKPSLAEKPGPPLSLIVSLWTAQSESSVCSGRTATLQPFTASSTQLMWLLEKQSAGPDPGMRSGWAPVTMLGRYFSFHYSL